MGDIIRYTCPACFNGYGSIADLEAHRRNVHGWQDTTDGGRIGELEQENAQLRAEVARLTELLRMQPRVTFKT